MVKNLSLGDLELILCDWYEMDEQLPNGWQITQVVQMYHVLTSSTQAREKFLELTGT